MESWEFNMKVRKHEKHRTMEKHPKNVNRLGDSLKSSIRTNIDKIVATCHEISDEKLLSRNYRNKVENSIENLSL